MFSLDQLDIAGYANVLTESTVPSIVAPVFRDRENQDLYFFPPFIIHDRHLCDPSVSTKRDFDQLAQKGEVTVLPEPFQARSGYELWIDDTMNAHYERASRVHETLVELSKTYTETAEALFREKKFEEADFYCSHAISANGNNITPWTLKAAIRTVEGKQENANLLGDLIRHICSKSTFDVLVNEYVHLLKPLEHHCHAENHRNVMSGLAALSEADAMKLYYNIEKAA